MLCIVESNGEDLHLGTQDFVRECYEWQIILSLKGGQRKWRSCGKNRFGISQEWTSR